MCSAGVAVDHFAVVEAIVQLLAISGPAVIVGLLDITSQRG